MTILNKIFVFFIMCNLSGCIKSVVLKKDAENIKKVLKNLVAIDQQIVNPHPNGVYSNISENNWKSFKDSLFRENTKIAKDLFKRYGFLDISDLGNEGAFNFWLIVQHSDFDLEFQTEILKAMKNSIRKKRTSLSNYAYLYDRVKINSNQKQKFGTQLTYNELGQAILKDCSSDSLTLVKLRRKYGLDEIKIYLNQATINHFNLNKNVYLKMGILSPNLYK
jgi:hypothetical protein